MSVINYHYSLRNTPEERSSHEFSSFTRAFILNFKNVHKLTAANLVILLQIVKCSVLWTGEELPTFRSSVATCLDL